MLDMFKLYDENTKKIMEAAEDSSSFGSNRIEEICNFAQAMNFKRIGIANCITFSGEAEIIKKYMNEKFEVFNVDCKYGRLKKDTLLGGSSSRVLCNPAGQAAYLNEHRTDLNISLGLCVGHDMIFSSNSAAPVTSLFCKDFTNNHNPGIAVQEIRKKLKR